jgi:hypothetical protein
MAGLPPPETLDNMNKIKFIFFLGILALLCFCLMPAAEQDPGAGEIRLDREDTKGQLTVFINGKPAFIYQYAPTVDLAHYWPLNSPSGKNMLVQQTEPYPHHRSFWFADTVKLNGGREISIYNALYTGEKVGAQTYKPPFRDHIRHQEFVRCQAEGSRAEIDSKLVWEMDYDKPVLDEKRQLIVTALGEGEYLLDIMFTLTASYGDVEFVSDAVHYAWPYLRMHPRFSGENGGVITTDNGAKGQEATNMKPALWIDYSNTVEGKTEGLAVFQYPDGKSHNWLTREYGCFGPRRPDDQSGKPFTLKKGQSLSQRVGVLVHRGDVKSGRVSQRYLEYIKTQQKK